MKILVTEPIASVGIDILKEHAIVDVLQNSTQTKLQSIISEYDALMVRSQTKVTAKIIEYANNLRVNSDLPPEVSPLAKLVLKP